MKISLTLVLVFVLGILTAPAQVQHFDTDYFDPKKGFKPAGRDLSEIYLQMALSLKYYGSPVPYLKHVKAENTRVETLYFAKYGKKPTSYCPDYMTDEYLNQVQKNWDTLSPQLGLSPITMRSGELIRDAINGTRGTGTILVEIFNTHQAKVVDGMTGKKPLVDFDVLKEQLVARLELGKTVVDEEAYETNRRDAVSFSLGVEGNFLKLFTKLDAALKPEDSAKIKGAILSVILDTGRMTQSELEIGLAEKALAGQVTASR